MPKQWATELSEKIIEEYDIEIIEGMINDTVQQCMNVGQVVANKDPVDWLKSVIDTPEAFNIVYTMPMSTGDVFISTAVIDGLLKECPPDTKVYFATRPEFAGVLKNNPQIHKVIDFQDWMLNLDFLEKAFDLVLTPNVATQYTFSNWVRRGQGRLLAEEFANHCHTELGNYFIDKEVVEGLPEKYVTFHPGSGKGKWQARRYSDWSEVLSNFKKLYPELKVVQVGAADEPKYSESDVDLRGKTNHQQLAYIVGNAKLHLSIDTFSMHLAAALEVPLVALFGCSYASSTGPWVKDKNGARFVLLQSERHTGCKDKACYKDKCAVNPENPPINEIDPKQILVSACALLGRNYGNTYPTFDEFNYSRVFGKISGYTTTYNAMDYPFEASIKSMLGFCDEVVVVDGCSNDGTYEVLEKMAADDDRIKVYQNEFDWNEPGIDGMQKAYARALCENEFLWQQDVDEVVHEDDYEKIKMITKRFPSNFDILIS
jgi:ADP-heptose:LPS heptosyltransferase